MGFLPQEQIISDLEKPFHSYIDQFGIEDIGIFEEEGQEGLKRPS